MDQKYFNSRYTFDRSRKKVWQAIAEYLQPYLAADSILELGAGYGDFINQIKAPNKYALDINPQAAGYCGADVKFIHSDLSQISLPNGSIGAIFASNLLEHLNDAKLEILFSEINRVLKPGGKVIFIQPNIRYCCREYWDDFTHVKAFSDISLKDFLVSRGFKIIRVEKRFLPFSFKSIFPKSYRLAKFYLQLLWKPFAKQMLIIAEK
ncbi:MAG: class I SAM-dependent methyltransferase [Patescibacteria group bacterium]|nr:class I SAM-dependent methyltransferase [Patescibacteria group bacterium]